MNKQQAIKLYIRKNPMAQHMIKKLLLWDESKTFQQNQMRLSEYGAAEGPLRQFQCRYQLKFKTTRPYVGCKSKLKPQAYTALRKAGWSFKQIAIAFGITKQSIQQSIRRIA